MQKTFILILLCFMFLAKSKAQDSASTFFVNLNVNIVKINYTNYVSNSQIGSQVKSVMNILKPSILIRTKRRNFREFELTNFLFSNSNTTADGVKFINYGNSSGKDTSLAYRIKYKQTLIQITHRFGWNLLKKKSKRYGLGPILSNSIGFNFYKTAPLHLYAYNRTSFSVFTTLDLGLFMNYQLNNKLIIGIQRNIFLSSIQFTKHHIDNPLFPEEFRNQAIYDFNLHLLPPGPSIFVLNVAYKL